MSGRLTHAALLVVLLHGLVSAQFIAVLVLLEGETATGLSAAVQGVGRPAVNLTGLTAIEGDDSNSALDDFIWVGSGILLVSGDPIAGTQGFLDNVNPFDSTRPINTSGAVAWSGDLDGVPLSVDQVLGVNSTALLTEGMLSPIASRNFQEFSFVSIDDLGRVYFEADLDGTSSDDEVLMVHTGLGVLPLSLNANSLFREGQAIVGGPLSGHTWDNGAFIDLRVNGSGTILVEGDLETTGVGIATSLDNEVLVRKVSGQDYELLLREGVTLLATPVAGIAPFESIHEIALADNGDWAVRGSVDDAVTTLEFNDVAIADLAGFGPIVIAQEGMSVSAETGYPDAILGAIQGISVNSSLQVLILANVESRIAPIPFDEALFLYDAGTLTMVLADELSTVPALGFAPLTGLTTDHAALGENGEILFGAEVLIGGIVREGIFEAVLPAVYPVENITCVQSTGSPGVTATWVNPLATPYDGIRIIVDGVLTTTLTGGETGYQTPPFSPVNVLVTLEIEPFIGADDAFRRACTTFVTSPQDIVACSTPLAPIFDFTSTTDTINIPNSATIRELTISLRIMHSAIGDLDIGVTSPSGTTVVLTTDNGGSADDFDLTFADFGLPLAGTPLNAGLFIAPEGPGTFEDLRCEPVGGDWTLSVADDGGGDQGTWIDWCVNVTEEPDPAANCCSLPTALTANNVGVCSSGAVRLDWQNNAAYAALEIARDDGSNSTVIFPISATATSLNDTTAFDGTTYTYTLRAQCSPTGIEFVADSVSLTVDALSMPSVTDLAASSDFCSGSISLAWNDHGIPFDSLQLLRNGLFLADVTGTTSFTDASPPVGAVDYSVVAVCGALSASVDTLVEHSLQPPEAIECVTDSTQCDGIVSLSWSNSASYQALELRIDGLVPTPGISAGATSYTTSPLNSGDHVFEWFAECNGFLATASCVTTVSAPPGGESDCILALEGSRTAGNHGAIDSGGALAAALLASGVSTYTITPLSGGDIVTGLPCGVDLGSFDRIWVLLGTFPNDYRITPSEGDLLALLNRDIGVPMLLESGDHWGFQHAVSALDSRDGVEPNAGPSLIVDGDDTFTSMAAVDSPGLNLSGQFPSPVPYGQDNPNGPDYTDRLTLSGDTPGALLDAEVISAEALWLNSADGIPDATDPDEGIPYITAALTTPTIGAPILVQSFEFGGFGRDPLDPAASDAQRVQLAEFYVAALGGIPPSGTEWVRGDTNDDGGVNIADAIYLLNGLFPGGAYTSSLLCLDAANANGDPIVNIADAVAILDSLFLPGAAALPSPNASEGCGSATGTPLGCDQFTHCP